MQRRVQEPPPRPRRRQPGPDAAPPAPLTCPGLLLRVLLRGPPLLLAPSSAGTSGTAATRFCISRTPWAFGTSWSGTAWACTPPVSTQLGEAACRGMPLPACGWAGRVLECTWRAAHAGRCPATGCACLAPLCLRLPCLVQTWNRACTRPAALKWVMAAFDVPEAIAVGRTAMCAGGLAALTRLQAAGYYLGVLAYYWCAKRCAVHTAGLSALQSAVLCWQLRWHLVTQHRQAGAERRSSAAAGESPSARRRRNVPPPDASRAAGCWPRPPWASSSAVTCTSASTGAGA